MIESGVWRLPSRLTFLSVDSLRKTILDEKDVCYDWFFDLRDVSEIDQSGLDWLLAVRNRVMGAGFGLFFLNTPHQFKYIIGLIERDQVYSGRRPAHA